MSPCYCGKKAKQAHCVVLASSAGSACKIHFCSYSCALQAGDRFVVTYGTVDRDRK